MTSHVYGCSISSFSDPDFCLECESHLLLDEASGQCNCPTPGQKPNNLGVCEDCTALGCSSCIEGQPTKCAKCYDCMAFVEQSTGDCKCPSNDAIFD